MEKKDRKRVTVRCQRQSTSLAERDWGNGVCLQWWWHCVEPERGNESRVLGAPAWLIQA
jgi:hypothetical protein